MGVDNAFELCATLLTLGSLFEQIIVASEKHSVERCDTIEQIGVERHRCPIFVCGENVDLSRTQTTRDRSWDVMIHIQLEGHETRPG